jgi:predicted GIY-YIG superfamily endonuclease
VYQIKPPSSNVLEAFLIYMKNFMITIYIIQSEIDGTYYTGMASDVEKRLKEHNSGKSKYTKSKKPWKLVYQEYAEDWESSRKREKYLKTTAGKNWALKNKE